MTACSPHPRARVVCVGPPMRAQRQRSARPAVFISPCLFRSVLRIPALGSRCSHGRLRGRRIAPSPCPAKRKMQARCGTSNRILRKKMMIAHMAATLRRSMKTGRIPGHVSVVHIPFAPMIIHQILSDRIRGSAGCPARPSAGRSRTMRTIPARGGARAAATQRRRSPRSTCRQGR